MKKWLVLVFVLLVTACTSGFSDWNMLGKNTVRILSGDDSQVLLYDANGIVPSSGQKTATKYCATYGKTAEWQSNGGTDSDCVSAQLNYCATYICK